jgi:hypothetical protein
LQSLPSCQQHLLCMFQQLLPLSSLDSVQALLLLLLL